MKDKYRAFFSILALFTLCAAAALPLKLILPPAPKPADAPAVEFSAGRAMRHLAFIAHEPHPMGGSKAHAEVRDYLLQEIRSFGLDPQVQKTFGQRIVRPGFFIGGPVENILVRLPGSDSEGAIVLISHYDTTPGAPGGVDSSSGVVTILEMLRALQASPMLRHDVIVLFTDGEEPGTIGAHSFVAQHDWFDDIRAVINMDQFKEGPPNLIRHNRGNGFWVQAIARSAVRPAFVSLPYHLFPGGETDLVPFAQAGLPTADIMTTAPYPENHTARDLPEIIDPGSVQMAGEQSLALVRDLGDQPSLVVSFPEQTYFPILGKLVHYPNSWALPAAIIAGLAFLGVSFYGFQRRELTGRDLITGLLIFLLSMLLSLGIANLLWLGVEALHPAYAYSGFRPHLSDDHLYAIALISVPLVVTSSIISLARKKIGTLDLAAGVLVVWLPIAIASAILIPMSSYLASWGLLGSSLALWLALITRSAKGNWALSGLGFLASAILVTFLWIPVIYLTFLGSGFMQLNLMVGVAALWIVSMIPILDWITAWNRWLIPTVSTLAAFGFLLAGHILVGRASPPPLVNSIGYWMDADRTAAYWVAFTGGYRLDAKTTERRLIAFPSEMDERQIRLLPNPVQRPYTELMPEAPLFSVQTSSAPVLEMAGPRLEVINYEREANLHVVKVQLTASLQDRIYILIPEESALLAITVPNNERTELPPADEGGWMLRFDGMPADGIKLRLEFNSSAPIRFNLVEQSTGLPSFPGLSTQPEPGTMVSPGEYNQCLPSDFTAIYREYAISESTR